MHRANVLAQQVQVCAAVQVQPGLLHPAHIPWSQDEFAQCSEESVVSSHSEQVITPAARPCLYLELQPVLMRTSFCLTAEMIDRNVFRQENPIRAPKTTAPGNPAPRRPTGQPRPTRTARRFPLLERGEIIHSAPLLALAMGGNSTLQLVRGP